MKILALSAILFAMPALATGEDQTLDFSVSVAGRDLGLYLVAGPTDCPATRFLILGSGIQAVSAPLLSGESAVLPIGNDLAVGAHQVQVQAMDCPAALASVHLLTLGQSSPGHGRAQPLATVATAGN